MAVVYGPGQRPQAQGQRTAQAQVQVQVQTFDARRCRAEGEIAGANCTRTRAAGAVLRAAS